MIEKIFIGAIVLASYLYAWIYPSHFSSSTVKDLISYDGLALMALIFTVTAAASVSINGKVLEISKSFAENPDVQRDARKLRSTMRRNTILFFYGFVVALFSFFLVKLNYFDNGITSLLCATYFSVMIVGVYLILDVYRVTFGLLETEALVDVNKDTSK